MAILDDLVALCTAQGESPVNTAAGAMSVKPGCDVLAQWDGTMNKESVGAVLFREFASEWSRNPQWQVPYDASQPLTTPSGLKKSTAALTLLGNAMARIQSVGLSIDAPLGEVQFVERALPNGTPSGNRLPWGLIT